MEARQGTHPVANASVADVAVVGAGPAGMMAALAAAEGAGLGAAGPGPAGTVPAARRVVILEQLDRPGARLLATGGGRCNLTNTLEARDFAKRFGRAGAFIRHAITELDPEALREFFGALGVETVAEEGGAVYPFTHSALTVQQAMVNRCRELGVQILAGTEAKDLLLRDGAVVGLVLAGGSVDGDPGGAEAANRAETHPPRVLEASRVIVACGGRSYAELGGTGGGYALARTAGHEIVEPTPALVDLRTKETWSASCAGISIAAARLSIDLPRAPRARSAGPGQAHSKGPGQSSVTGDVLFTHEGLSGPAALDLSGDVVERLRHRGEVPIRLEIWPGETPQQWQGRLDEWRVSAGRRAVRGLVAERMPARLAAAICDLSGVGPDATAAHLDSRQSRSLAEALAGLRLTATGSGGFQKAMVTRGGVDLRDVDARTMASRLVKGLFFAGEVLDVDGPCGGFNLQWAFASGRLAGLSAAR
jgi:predicted Rossmann fold flavoprotein